MSYHTRSAHSSSVRTRWRSNLRVGLVGLAILAVLIVAAQLLYPVDRGLPLASVAGTPARLLTHEAMARLVVEKFAVTKVKLAVGNDKSVEFELRKAGAEPNTELMVKRLSDYPWWQRLIPGSILWQPAGVVTADVYFDNKPLTEFVQEKSRELSFAAQPARLAIKDGKLVADEAVAGSEVGGRELLDLLSRASMKLGETSTLNVSARRLAPSRTSADLATVRREAETALAHSIVIAADAKTFKPPVEEIAAWIVLSDVDNKVSLAIDKDKIKAYLATLNGEVGTPAGQTNIAIVDGREVGRTTGAVGRAIAIDALTDQIVAGLQAAPKEVVLQAPFTEQQPSVIYNSKYTTSQAGLQAYVDDQARTKNVRISIHHLSGEGWSAAARENESIPSGSTYKLYVALVLFDKMQKGEIHWEDPMLDTTVAGCFERMTVASTNPCAESWIAQFGRQYIDDFVHARGFSGGTTFTGGGANRSTAADLTKYMIGLNDGSLVGGAYRDRLLDSLGRHPYRYGIPTGSRGIVHDKVGFLWDYIHDTAIVQHPRGAYVMTIMTKGYSYATIASITREVERIMFP